ncbi:hypothetical protein [Frankia sp. CcWB3]
MTKFLLSVHVLAAILAIGPITVAASMFAPAARLALTSPGDERAAGIVRVLHRICGVYSALGLVVPIFGFFTAQSLGVLGQNWLIVAIALTSVAAVVLLIVVLPGQRGVLDEIVAGSPAVPDRVQDGGAVAMDGGAVAMDAAAARARTSGLAMAAGVFSLLWVIVTVLMIIRPGSTTSV